MNIKYRVNHLLLDKSTLHQNKKSIRQKYKISNYIINRIINHPDKYLHIKIDIIFNNNIL
jgi:hypothetical protein